MSAPMGVTVGVAFAAYLLWQFKAWKNVENKKDQNRKEISKKKVND